MGKSTQLIEMIDLLRAKPGIEVEELARAMGRSQRTVYRWLGDITDSLGMKVTCRHGGYYLTEGPVARHISLSSEELLALRLGLRSAPLAVGSPLADHARSAWIKIRDGASPEDLEAAGRLASSHAISVYVPSAGLPSGLVETLDRAISTHQRLRVIYRSQSRNRTGEYTFDPYAMAFRRHAWYVVGYCVERGKQIQLRLQRFISAVETGSRFKPPKDFSVERFFGLSWEAWGGGEPTHVRVRFSPAVARMIAETKRHPTQVVRPDIGGSVIFEATVSGVKEIGIWILGYGKNAEVLHPPELRDFILDHVRGMARIYGSEADPDSVSGTALRSVPETPAEGTTSGSPLHSTPETPIV